MILLVSYDLKAPGRDYTGLYATLKTAPSWWHYLGSTWLLYITNSDINEWQRKIKAVIDDGDSLIIVDITRQKRNGWLPQKAWEWIREHEKL